MVSKPVFRAVRFHPLMEWGQNKLRPLKNIQYPHINMPAVAVGRGDVVIDCGANVGSVASRFARTGATVFAFEPNPVCYKILTERFAMLRTVRCLNKGVASRRCTMTLRTPRAHNIWDDIDVTVSGSFVAAATSPYSDCIETEIECVDLSNFIQEIGHVKLLKLDIEGSEIEVINGLIDTDAIAHVDYALVETHERFSDELRNATEALRKRIERLGLTDKINLNWD